MEGEEGCRRGYREKLCCATGCTTDSVSPSGTLEQKWPYRVVPALSWNAVVRLLSCVQLFATPWTTCSTSGFAVHHQLPELAQTHVHSWWCHPTISSSVVLFSSCPPSFPASGSFPKSGLFTSGGQSIGASASASDLPISIQVWFPVVLTGLISFSIDWFDLLAVQGALKNLFQYHSMNSSALSLFYCSGLTSVHDYWKNHSFDYIWTFVGKVMSLLFNTLSRFVIAFLPGRNIF